MLANTRGPLAFLLLLPVAAASVVSSAVAADSGSGVWRTVFYDDFDLPDGSKPDPRFWNVKDNYTHGGQEWELYLADEVYVQNGSLVLRTEVKDAVGPTGGRVYHFTSGWADTLGKVEVTYGLFEARIRLPVALVGLWPAFWLVDDNNHCWPEGGEIDILEAVGGFRNDSIFGTYHWGQGCGKDDWVSDGQRNGDVLPPPGGAFSDQFVNFSAYWNASMMTWALNGAPYVSRVAGQPADLFVPSWPLYTIFDTALAFWSGPQPPPTTGYPAFMAIDWYRISAFDGPGGATGQFPIPYNATGLGPG